MPPRKVFVICWWLNRVKQQAERECTEAKRRGDSAQPNPKGAQASARSPICQPSEFISETGGKRRCALRLCVRHSTEVIRLKLWYNVRRAERENILRLEGYIGEATSYDKKLMFERKDPTSWLKSVSAFANTQGGKLLFGVANDGVLDWTNVISVRRNPVIADLFQRLDLMERRGSGLKKILESYAFESEKRGVAIRPLFHSSQTDFFAVLPNLNYGRAIDQMAGQVTGQVTGHVAGYVTGRVTGPVESHATGLDEHIPVNVVRLLRVMKTEMGIHEIMAKIRLSSRAHLRKSALCPALELGLVAMTQPNSPRSPTQKYRLTERGRAVVKSVGKRNRP